MVWLFVLWSIGLSPKASGIYTPTTPRTPRPSAGAGAAAAAGRDPLTGEYRTVQEVPVPAKSRETSEPLTADTDDTGVKARSLTTRISYEGMLVTFGGHNGEEFLSSVESWVPGSKGWKGEADMLQPRAHFASCIYNGRIWAMGGWDPYNKERMQADATEAKALDSVEIFQPRLGSWSLGPRMVSARAFHGAHTVGGSIYLVGGFDGTRDLDLVDRLEVARGTWIRGRPLKHARSGCVCGSVRGRLFVMGGHNGLQGLGTCESLDPREGRWRQEPDMLYHRAYPAATSAGDCIFVGGGNFGISYLDTVEMYDARKGAWRMLPSLNIKRNGASLALVGDALYAVGGFDGESECLSVTEKLDLSKPISSQPWQVNPCVCVCVCFCARTHTHARTHSNVYIVLSSHAHAHAHTHTHVYTRTLR